MGVNTDKCKVITFTRRSNCIVFPYTLNNVTLERVSEINDLGVILDSELRFASHFDFVLNKSFRTCGFIKRQSIDFWDISCLHKLFVTLVRPILEYCFVIWFPFYKTHVDRLERVQRKFVNYLLFKMGINKDNYSYDQRLVLVNLELLESRKQKAEIRLGYKLFQNCIDCPGLVMLFDIRVPRLGSRCSETFIPRFHRTNFTFHAPMDNTVRSTGKCYNLTFISVYSHRVVNAPRTNDFKFILK